MIKISETTKYWGDSPMDGGMFEAKVQVTPTEKKSLAAAGHDEDYWIVDKLLFEVAGCKSEYSGGPGQPFVNAPGFSVKGDIATVHQFFGYDI